MLNAPDYPANDDQFQVHEIKTAELELSSSGKSYWMAHFVDGWRVSFEAIDGMTVSPGDVVRLYGKGIGFSIRGVFVNGVKVRYLTSAEADAEHAATVAAGKAKKVAEAEANKAEFDARISKLPAVFQDRIKGFRERNPSFRAEFEPYELFCLEQAALFAEVLKTNEAIQAFAWASYDEQKRLVPGVSEDHSGNTMGFSLRMARFLMPGEDNTFAAQNMHGAMCPLVGCKDYGCYSTTQSKEAKYSAASVHNDYH